jgi:hypothetical protein
MHTDGLTPPLVTRFAAAAGGDRVYSLPPVGIIA